MPFIRFAPFLGVLGAGAGGGYLLSNTALFATNQADDSTVVLGPVPSRAQQLSRLQGSTRDQPFDLLIVGGGATGTGCAVDAVTRYDLYEYDRCTLQTCCLDGLVQALMEHAAPSDSYITVSQGAVYAFLTPVAYSWSNCQQQ